jgi:hypothetical protein
MPGTVPIRLGSATSGFTFETGSRVTTSESGIQSCAVKALWPTADTIFSNLPVAGATFNSVFGNSFLPSSFLLDYTDSGPDIEYLEGIIARVTLQFKRQDPTQTNVRKIFVDSVINYESPLNENTLTFIAYSGGGAATSGLSTFGPFGFPEPVVTVKYNTNTRPGIGSGSLSQLYALPGSTNALGFPNAPSIFNQVSVPVQPGGSATYYDATAAAFVLVGPVTVLTTLTFVTEYRPNVLGWQLTRLKSDPVAASAFFDVEEEWRTYYFAYGSSFVSAVPPLPP